MPPRGAGLGFPDTGSEQVKSFLVVNWNDISRVLFAVGMALAIDAAAAASPDKAGAGTKPDPSAGVFGFDKLHQFHLTMSAKEWEGMQPAEPRMPGGFPGGPGRPEPPAKPKTSGDRTTHRGNMVEYPVACGNLADGERTYTNVTVRYKGNFTYMASAHALKRSLKIDFEQSSEDESGFHGLRKVNLHAGVLDPTRQREALSYAVFREAGVPAPRTAFVELTLTVPGKYDREYVGLYTLVEQVDKRFLKNRFGKGNGLLLKPQGVRGPEYLGEKWQDYEGRYRPDRPPSAEEARRVMGFATLVTRAEETEFRAQIGAWLELDEFLRFLAANALLVNLDSPLAMPQNFYLYLDPRSNRFVFMPWDLDLSLAAWPMGGAPEQQMDLSLMHPHTGEHKLIDRLLAVPAVREQVQSHSQGVGGRLLRQGAAPADHRNHRANDKGFARKGGQGGGGAPGRRRRTWVWSWSECGRRGAFAAHICREAHRVDPKPAFRRAPRIHAPNEIRPAGRASRWRGRSTRTARTGAR